MFTPPWVYYHKAGFSCSSPGAAFQRETDFLHVKTSPPLPDLHTSTHCPFLATEQRWKRDDSPVKRLNVIKRFSKDTYPHFSLYSFLPHLTPTHSPFHPFPYPPSQNPTDSTLVHVKAFKRPKAHQTITDKGGSHPCPNTRLCVCVVYASQRELDKTGFELVWRGVWWSLLNTRDQIHHCFNFFHYRWQLLPEWALDHCLLNSDRSFLFLIINRVYCYHEN